MLARIAEWLPLFFRPDDVFEIRALDVGQPGRKSAGWFLGGSADRAAAKIAEVAETAGGVYFTPNPSSRDCYRRAANCLRPVIKSKTTQKAEPQLTHDSDVAERRWLMIDIDPVKPAEFKNHSATDAEKESTAEVADRVRAYLASQRWPAPLVVDSGNGLHLYYRLAEPLRGGPAETTSDLLAGLLRSLASRFDTAGAGIDVSVFNAARIMKVPGTPSRKGKPTKDRPHRVSQVIEVPGDWMP